MARRRGAPSGHRQGSAAQQQAQIAGEARRRLGIAGIEFEPRLPRHGVAPGRLRQASQARLRADFAALDAMERRGWLLGPALGADFFALQPLLGFVPEDEREPLLAALRALAPEQRALLGEMARRTPPAGREALRRELLATAPASRSAWLEQRSRQ